MIVLAILVFVGAIAWLFGVVFVLLNETYPEGLWRFLLGIVRWQARLLAYLASLTDRYPLFMLETGSVSVAGPSP
jgi:NADH:ubiquinone oxidoreductase subunit 6 (subunit J)